MSMISRVPLVFQPLLVGLFCLVLISGLETMMPVHGIALTFFEVVAEGIAFIVVLQHRREVPPEGRRALACILVMLPLLAIADVSYCVLFYGMGSQKDDPIAVALTVVPYALAFSCVAAAPIVHAGRHFFRIAPPTGLVLSLAVLAFPWVEFVAEPTIQRISHHQVSPLLAACELFNIVASLAASTIALTVAAHAIAVHWALFFSGALTLTLADWAMKADEDLGTQPAQWPFEFFWAGAIAVLACALIGDCRPPDIERRMAASSVVPTERKAAIGFGLLLTIPACIAFEDLVPQIACVASAVFVVGATLIAAIRHPSHTERVMATEQLDRPPEIVVVTNARTTRVAICRAFQIQENSRCRVRGRFYWRKEGAVDDQSYTVVVTQAPSIGNVDCAVRVVAAVADWAPKVVLVVGSVETLDSSVALGDVVVADALLHFELGTNDVDLANVSSVRVRASSTLFEGLRALEEWDGRSHEGPPRGLRRDPMLHMGTVACGPKRLRDLLVASPEAEITRGLRAVETDGFGFDAVTARKLGRVPHLVLCGVDRSVSEARTPEWERFAAANVAAASRHFFGNAMSGLVSRFRPRPPPHGRPSVFLCHSSTDKWFVREIARRLDCLGARAWIDEAEIEVGASLRERIESALRRAHHVAVVLSPASIASEWVRHELHVTMERERERSERLLLPILLEHADLPDALHDRLYADFTTRTHAGFEREFNRVVDAVGLRVFGDRNALSSSGGSSTGLVGRAEALCAVETFLVRWLGGNMSGEFVVGMLQAEFRRWAAQDRSSTPLAVQPIVHEIERLLREPADNREEHYRDVVVLFQRLRHVLDTEMSTRARSSASAGFT